MEQVRELDAISPASDHNIINEYFRWLCEIIKIDQPDKSYWLLAKALHKKEFFWTVPNDDNRGSDGKKLREEFADENGYLKYDKLERPCSMLEMLVGLSKRMEDYMTDPEKGDRTDRWFWEMITNVGLLTCTDSEYYEYNDGAIDEVLDRVLERTYKRSGKGGLFPLKEPKKDQREVELWYQMCSYLLENYYIDGEIL
jgi:hypothetical protein